MEFRVLLHPKASDYLTHLAPSYERKIMQLLRLLKKDPVPSRSFDVKKIVGKESTYRVRIGKYRIIYDIDFDSKAVYVTTIDLRKSAYD